MSIVLLLAFMHLVRSRAHPVTLRMGRGPMRSTRPWYLTYPACVSTYMTSIRIPVYVYSSLIYSKTPPTLHPSKLRKPLHPKVGQLLRRLTRILTIPPLAHRTTNSPIIQHPPSRRLSCGYTCQLQRWGGPYALPRTFDPSPPTRSER